jgi:phospholipid-transporting ATPase
MELIGSTAIEDKLQDEVADTIQFAKAAGVKVWVLTGDKIETATNIGFSAGLLDSHMTLHSIEEIDETELHLKIGNINVELDSKTRPSSAHFGPKRKEAIIVAGASLIKIDDDIELRELFLKAATRVDVVLACRVSPKQKADVVNLIKKRFPDKTTLSIGDGANDVSMILQAHVGIGILGKEGQQAARSADFAIGQFKFLKPLLFYHGREAYRRNSLLILYNFYKNFLYVVPQFYFGFYAAFAGQPLYEQMIYQMYNITMTSLPILWYSVYDFEHKKDIDMQMTLPKSALQDYFMRNPLLYRCGIERNCFSTWLFVKWLIYSLVHAAFIFYACFYVMVQPLAH